MDCHSGLLTYWRLSLVVLLLCRFRGECNGDPIIIEKSSAQQWAKILGDRLNVTSSHYSGVQFLRQEYNKREDELNLTRVEGVELRDRVRTQINDFLQLKVTAVESIVEALETSYSTYNFSKPPPESGYLNALNFTVNQTKDWPWVVDPRFDSQPVLLTNSTIHVPTVVYNKDIELLREIEASDVLESVFIKNLEKDYTLKWQYYGSKIGFMRNFPGISWTLENNINLFDCRRRSWYSQAIAPPKTVLFLVDMSGSQTGLAIGMTHLMVPSTIDSLGENDYFNIMTFNDTTKLIDECYQERFLQSTYQNKERMKTELLEIVPEHESNICDALRAAFVALEEARRSGSTSECSEAIMLFTDGVEFTCEEVFAEKNKNGTVRVFTYLLGESNQHAGILKSIACSNHGKYTRITVRSDVPEKVAGYLPIMGRPLVQEGAHPTVWSNTYRDFLSNELVITVSQIVHNTTKTGKKEGDAGGVASVDVPLISLQKLVPPYKFGVNGYMFMITNNGFITYHPDRRSMHQGQPVAGISTQDVTDVEQSQQFDQLRRDMIDRKIGQTTFPVERPFDDLKRLKELEQTYYYTDIPSTPFSLAVVVTEDGKYQINPVKTVSINKTTQQTTGTVADELKVLMNLMSKDQVKLADWIPCWLLTSGGNESTQSSSPAENFKLFLQEIKNETDPDMATAKCDIDWTNLLLLDLRATASFSQHWNFLYNISSTEVSHENPFGVNMIEDLPYGDETTNTYRYGMIASFLATVGGLNQYYDISEYRTEGLVNEYPNTVTEDYFARSVNDVEGEGFVYSFPPNSIRSDSENNDTEEEKVDRVSVVTAYSAVKVNDKTVAVAGHQMTLKSFVDIFRNATSSCEGVKPCNHTCSSKGVTCILMDKHGYILVSSINEMATGQHLAFVETIAFQYFVEKGIMYRRSFADYQALCKDNTPQYLQSACSYILNPLSQVKNLVTGFVQNAILMLTTFGWYDWLLMMVFPSPASPEIYQHVDVFLPCDLNYTYYKLNSSKLRLDAQEGAVPALSGCAEDCSNSYVLAMVPNTNLALLVLTQSGDCACPGLESFEQVSDVNYNITGENICEDEREPVYRRPISDGCVMSTKLDEESTECGSASFLQPSKLLLILATFHLLTRFLIA